MFKKIAKIYKDTVKSLIEKDHELLFAEEYSDIPVGLKIIAMIFSIIIDIFVMILLVAFTSVLVLVGCLVGFIWPRAFDKQEDLT